MAGAARKFSSIPKYFFRFLIVFLGLGIIFAIVVFYHGGRVDAQVSSFYSTSCLGGWQNVSYAEGPPEVTPENGETYNIENSAYVYNASAQIYCGGFTGEIPSDALKKKVRLKFSWATGEIEENEGEEGNGNVESAPEIIEEAESVGETPSAEEETSEQAEPVPEPTPEALPATDPVEPVSYFHIPVAHAEEVETLREAILKPVSDIPPGTIFEVLYTLNGSEWTHISYAETIDDDFGEELPAEFFTNVEDLNKIQIAIHTVPNYDYSKVIYLDSVWLEVEYEHAEEEVALSSQEANVLEATEDFEKMVEEAGNIEENTEGPAEVLEEVAPEEKLSLPITKEEIIPEPTPPVVEVPPSSPWPLLSVRKFTKNIVIDPGATHRCEARPFTVNIGGVDIYIMQIFLVKNGEGIYKLEIGSLPDGVDVSFPKNGGYMYEPGSGETVVDLKIENEDGSRKGNFSVMIYFTKKGAIDSSTVCQLNVVNK